MKSKYTINLDGKIINNNPNGCQIGWSLSDIKDSIEYNIKHGYNRCHKPIDHWKKLLNKLLMYQIIKAKENDI